MAAGVGHRNGARVLDLVPGGEVGVGLALQDDKGRYLFILAGQRHRCPPGELFYAGVGGHLEAGEDLLSCAHREAREEIGGEVNVFSSPVTWRMFDDGRVERVEVVERPRPWALYEMIHPPGTRRGGQAYWIVIYRAAPRGEIWLPDRDEVGGVIALTAEQVIAASRRRPTLAEVLAGGGELVAGGESLPPATRLYPLGTARAVARLLTMSGSG